MDKFIEKLEIQETWSDDKVVMEVKFLGKEFVVETFRGADLDQIVSIMTKERLAYQCIEELAKFLPLESKIV